MNYLEKYPKIKSWYDLNFELFNCQLARLQIRCSCRSGAQLPSCCAHSSACLWLIFYVLKTGNINELLKENKRDEKILDTINDLTPYSEYLKKKKSQSLHYCWVCKNVEEPEDDDEWIHWVECNNCVLWCHPECLCTTMDEIEQDRFTYEIWHCRFCSSQDVFVSRNI